MRSNAIRKSARDEECTLNIVGVCNYNTETTVLAHLPDESNGIGTKPDDISACYACSSCHDVIDGRVKWNIEASEKEWYYRRAQTRTLRRLIDKEIITIKGLK